MTAGPTALPSLEQPRAMAHADCVRSGLSPQSVAALPDDVAPAVDGWSAATYRCPRCGLGWRHWLPDRQRPRGAGPAPVAADDLEHAGAWSLADDPDDLPAAARKVLELAQGAGWQTTSRAGSLEGTSERWWGLRLEAPDGRSAWVTTWRRGRTRSRQHRPGRVDGVQREGPTGDWGPWRVSTTREGAWLVLPTGVWPGSLPAKALTQALSAGSV